MANEQASQQPNQQQHQIQGQQQQAQIENIKVAVRLRPFTEREKQRNSKRIVDIEQNTVAIYSSKYGTQDEPKKFTFDYSYWSHDGFKRRSEDGVNVPDISHPNGTKYVGQEKVFEDLGLFLMENALQGYDSALLAYGQTGSGKSYTVSGYGTNEGILPRFARELFAELSKQLGFAGEIQDVPMEAARIQSQPAESRDEKNDDIEGEKNEESNHKNERHVPQNRYEVYFSMIEIYNEVVRDLLAKNHVINVQEKTTASSITRRGLKVREHPKRGFFVENLTSIKCANKEEIEQLIEEGQLNKSIVATSMNETSSRGHTIYEFRIRQYRKTDSIEPGENATTTNLVQDESQHKETLTSSVVQLVDLAGSERMAVHAGGTPLVDLPVISSRSNSPFGETSNETRATTSTRRVKPTTSRSTSRAPPMSASSTISLSTVAGGGSQRASKQQPGALLITNTQQQHHHQRFKESVSINQSLSALGNCIQVLSQFSQQQANSSSTQSKPPKIPYRDSVLTKLLNRCCLSGNSKVVIIATLSPADANYDDTLSTLRFADRAKQIRTHAVVNRMDTSQVQQQRKAELVGVLQRENERLKQLIDGRATTTRSDDSSQTSNFDDTENMLDNFNGPTASGTITSGDGKTTIKKKPGAKRMDAPSTPPRSRTNVRKRHATISGDTAAASAARSRSRPPAQIGAGTSNKPKSKLAASSSIPTLSAAASDSPLKRLVSPATSKQTKAQGSSVSDDEGGYDDDEDDQETVGGSDKTLEKSKSFAQANASGSPPLLNQILPEDSYELAELLDEIDLYDLANSDEGGLLSPDSDDSFAALAEEGLSNEEKIGLLNKLLKNSNVAEKIRKQYQKQQARLQRPKRAGANRSTNPSAEDEIQNASAINAKLKKSNPYLSNLNQDEQLTGMITFIIKEGEMIVGKNQDCDIMIFGPELRGRHAKLTRIQLNDDDNASADHAKTEVYIEPLMESTENQKREKVALMVNGEPVTQRIRLNHRDRLLFGSGAYFVFVDNLDGSRRRSSTEVDLVTYDMAHSEVLRKVISEAKNDAVIKEINDYTHRPGTGKHRSSSRAQQHDENEIKTDQGTKYDNSDFKHSSNAKHLTRTTTIQNENDSSNEQNSEQMSEIIEEYATGGDIKSDEKDSFKDKLMEDTYEFAMPVAEANAIAKEMGIKVTYGLKILTGEEQFLEQEFDVSTDSYYNHYIDSLNGSDTMSGSTSTNAGDERHLANIEPDEAPSSAKFKTSITRSIRPDTLDVPPELYVQVHLEEFNLNFYWSKEKFQERRVKMLELYGAWDVGGKSGLVEYLIEQSKYQGYYMIDPFIDDPLTSFVLIGHAQVTLQPLSHISDMKQSFDILDVNDDIVGSLKIHAVPCHLEESRDDLEPFKTLNEVELTECFIEDPLQLLNKRFVFLLKIVSCQQVPRKYSRIFCQYSLNREKSLIRTMIQRDDSLEIDQSSRSAGSSNSVGSSTRQHRAAGQQRQIAGKSSSFTDKHDDPMEFDHSNYIVIDQVNQDILDFLEHGFLTIQLVGQYRLDHIQQQQQTHTNSSSTSAASSSSSNPATLSSPTLVSTIINSINKYKYRIEQQSNVGGFNNGMNYSGSIFANSLTDSAKSHHRTTSGGMMKSNSDAPSIASTSATVNLFDQQNDDDATMNGLSQENIIDMILTKRKLDRAENQLASVICIFNLVQN